MGVGVLWGCQCGVSSKAKVSDPPPPHINCNLGLGLHCRPAPDPPSIHFLAVEMSLFFQCSEQLSSTGHPPSWHYFVMGRFKLSPKNQTGWGFLGLWITDLLRCD